MDGHKNEVGKIVFGPEVKEAFYNQKQRKQQEVEKLLQSFIDNLADYTTNLNKVLTRIAEKQIALEKRIIKLEDRMRML